MAHLIKSLCHYRDLTLIKSCVNCDLVDNMYIVDFVMYFWVIAGEIILFDQNVIAFSFFNDNGFFFNKMFERDNG